MDYTLAVVAALRITGISGGVKPRTDVQPMASHQRWPPRMVGTEQSTCLIDGVCLSRTGVY